MGNRGYLYNLGLRFQQIAQQYGDRIALWYDSTTQVSYAELNGNSNRMARLLTSLKVGQGDVVCISGTKTPLAFSTVLACLKLGAIYVILDPDSPTERIRKILSTCRPKLLFAEDILLDRLNDVVSELDITPLSASSADIKPRFADIDDVNLEGTTRVTGTNPAYIMYTSGSTGFPKGAVMTHANILNFIDWSQEAFGISCEDVLTNVNPQFFDNSVFDFYSALFSGACLVPFSKEEVRDPRRLVDKVANAGCTIWFSVPSLLIFLQTMRATDGRNLGSIRAFIFGGEGYPKAKLKQLYDAYKDKSEFFNVYGPTECTCICSSYHLSDDDFIDLQGLPPLGMIANNFDYLILDDDGRRVSAGDIGELCLLGPNVGKGYFNDPERTAASFVQNPVNEAFPELIYKTGDLVRHFPLDGKLYIHGRKDNQVKHMGYRIELEEIESAFHQLDYVAEAAAMHTTLRGLSRLIAVIALKEDRSDEQIRQDLREIIPDYMIPMDFARETMLPKNANGKVDRRLLRERFIV